MAIAEAKMLESGVFMPFTTNSGGLYGMSRIVPYTASPALFIPAAGDQAQHHDQCESQAQKLLHHDFPPIRIIFTNSGGLYGMSRIVPYTASPALWGLDSSRTYQYLVTNEISETLSASRALV